MKTPESATDNNAGRKTPEAGKDTNVLRKTPDEIKKGLEYCFSFQELQIIHHQQIKLLHASCLPAHVLHGYSAKPCVDCSYDKRDFPHCVRRLLGDAINEYNALESRLAQVERERDALVKSIKKMPPMGFYLIPPACTFCKNFDGDFTKKTCSTCQTYETNGNWEWRGVIEENTKEAAK